MSQYDLIQTTQSHCPRCGKPPMLLSAVDPLKHLPAFYVCFPCRFVGQVGVGPVLEAKGGDGFMGVAPTAGEVNLGG